MKNKGINWDTSRQFKIKGYLVNAIHNALEHGILIATQVIAMKLTPDKTVNLMKGMIHIYLEDVFESSQKIKEMDKKRRKKNE